MISEKVKQEHLQKISQELKRGDITLVVLSKLDTPKYGYSLKQELLDEGLDISQDTLYPLLRRLETQGLLTSDWNVDESRPRKYYILSELGAGIYGSIKKEWLETIETIRRIIL